MKIKNGVLLNQNFVEALMHFSRLPLPIKVSFPLQKCLKVFQAEETPIRAAKDDLIKKYGEPILNESGESIGWNIGKASKQNQDKFMKELAEFMELEFEIPLEKKLELTIKDVEDLKISSDHLVSMELLVDFKE